MTVLDHLPSLRQHLADVGDVPVADVGGEDRLQARTERVAIGVERDRRERIVGLAAEVEALEEALDVFLALDARLRELVEIRLVGIGEEAQPLVEDRKSVV